jgi:hypothetical protein
VRPLTGIGAADSAVSFRRKADTITENVVCLAKRTTTDTHCGHQRVRHGQPRVCPTDPTGQPAGHPRFVDRNFQTGVSPRYGSL